jgi:hypothetical protein
VRKINKKDLFYIGGLILLVAIFFQDVLFGGRSYWYRDIIRYLYPNRLLAGEMINQGQFPLWNPYLFCGLPLFANFQNGLLHPLSVLYYLFPFYLSFKYFIICQFCLAAAGGYVFLRFMKLSSYASFTGSLVFVFCGPLLSAINIFPILQSVIWLPLVYVFFVSASSRNYLWFSSLISLTMAMQLFGGQPEILLIDLLLMTALTFYYRREHGRFLKVWLVSLGLLLLVTAVQLLPFAEFVNQSQRQAGLPFAQVTDFSLHPREMLGFLLPHFKLPDNFSAGSFLKNLNLGLVPLLLLIFSCCRKNDRRFRLFALLGLASVLIALGKYFFLYQLFFNYVPGFSLFRYPVKFLFLGLLPLAVLSALGVEVVEDWLPRGRKWYLIAGQVLLAVGVLASLWLPSFHKESTVSDEMMRAQPSALKDRLSLDHDHFRIFLPGSTSKMVEEAPVTQITGFLPVYLSVLFENTGQAGHLSYVDGYEPLRTRYLANLINLLSTQPAPSATSLLNLLNVKYVISLKEIADPSLSLDNVDNGVRTYRNLKYMPRVSIIPGSRVAGSEGEIYRLFMDKKFDPAKTVILEDPAAPASEGGQGQAILADYSNQEVVVKAVVSSAGWLLLADSYYPGWRAYIDDRAAKIYKADYALRAVPLAAGQHLVSFKYQPFSFHLGLVISTATMLILFCLLSKKSKGIYV